VPSLKNNLAMASFYHKKAIYHVLNAFAAHSNNLKLAQRMYQARVLELKELILAEEARFKFVRLREISLPFYVYLVASSVAAEIEAIRAGKWDTKLEKGLEIAEDSPDRLAPSPQSEVCFPIWPELADVQLSVCSESA
jgi:hypothetical protein